MSLLRTKCRGCRETEFVEDSRQGDLICINCGVVASSHMISHESEWRSFSGETDCSRVGHSKNTFFNTKEDLHTDIAGPKSNLYKLNERLNDFPNKDYHNAITDICNSMGLPKHIENVAKEYLDKMPKKNVNSTPAACIYFACKNNNIARTIQEVCAYTSIPKVQLGREIIKVNNTLKFKNSYVDSSVYIERWSNLLGVKFSRVIKHNARYQQTSIAAGILYKLCKSEGKNITKSDIARVSGVSEDTIEKVYREI